ncbi:hypothetical protein JW756_06670 [Candidatus Woesearchaeota archaeon]|nr:hypothetical protein [Candidatus Woesearchaeota archaeon]
MFIKVVEIPKEMQYKTLGDIVNEALEEYHPPQTKTEKFKQKLEHFVEKHHKSINLASAALCAGAGYYILGKFGDSIANLYKQISQAALEAGFVGLLTGKYTTFAKAIEFINEYAGLLNLPALLKVSGAALGVAFSQTIETIRYPLFLGKRVYEKINFNYKKEKTGKILRYHKTLGFGLAAVALSPNLIKIPHLINEINQFGHYAQTSPIIQQAYLTSIGYLITDVGLYCAAGGALSVLFYTLKNMESTGKKGWENLFDSFYNLFTSPVGIISKKKRIQMLKKINEKRKSESTQMNLARTLFKNDVYEAFHYCKYIVDQRINQKIQFPSFMKKLGIGAGYRRLFHKKTDWVSFFKLMHLMREYNLDATQRVVYAVRENIKKDQVDVNFLLTYFAETYLKKQQDDYWANLTKNIIELCNTNKQIQEFQSSEGKVYSYKGSKLLNANVLIKEYQFDYFDRFIKERFEYEHLNQAGVKTEHILAFRKEGQQSQVLVTKEGNQSMRELLKDKNKAHKREVFEKLVEQGLLAQKILTEKAKTENGEYYADVNLRGKLYSAKIDILDLEKHLLHRAFMGDEKRGVRFGYNDLLPELLKEINSYREENYSLLILTMNHGDYFTTNISDEYVRFDPRHIIADALHDMTYVSLDPVFLELKKEEKAEIILKKMNQIHSFNNDSVFMKSFDYFYLHNGLGLSASQKSNNEFENAAIILNEIIEFSKEKPFERKMMDYLKNSNAKDLLKNI